MEKKNIIIVSLAVAILLIIVLIFFTGKKGPTKDPNVVDISVDYVGKEKGEQPSIDIIPLYDENGITSSNYFDFDINSKVDTRKAYYEVVIVPKDANTIDESALKVYLTDQSNNVIMGITPYNNLDDYDKKTGKIIYRGLIDLNSDKTVKNDSQDFRLRMWVNNDYKGALSGSFEFDILVDAEYVSDDYVINASAPLSLNTTSGNVLTGENITANIITISNGELTCNSSDEELATCDINNKTLTMSGIKAGEVIVTVTQSAGDVYSKSSTVTYALTITSSKSASEMSLNEESGSIYVGIEKNIEISTNGDGEITCKSSDEDIATCEVEEKILKVNGITSGNAVITVSQTEGEAMLAPEDVTYTVTDVKTIAAKTISEVSGLEEVPYGKIYSGSNPNNYVWFNNEQWRILGVYGDYLKIVRVEPYTTDQVYSNTTKSKLAWEGSVIQQYLDENYESIISDENSRNMVLENATWNVGSTVPQINAAGAYEAATKVEWKGRIGLITSFEYQYSSPNSCWTKTGDKYNSKCGTNNWLFSILTNDGSTDGAWTMSPDSTKGRALRVHQQKLIDDNPGDSNLCVSPVVYLKKEISITGGDGQVGEEGSYKLGF